MPEPRDPATPEPDQYAAERLREALAADPRVSDLSLQVHIVADNVFVTGQVPTEQRLEAVSAVAAQVLPDHIVHNELGVITIADPPSVERLP